MKQVAREEGLDPKILCSKIAAGKIVLPFNTRHRPKKVCAIGEGLRTKVNANIGTSADSPNLADELKKMKLAVKAGAHTVMDLSTGGNIRKIRQTILRNSPVALGTVPIYETAIAAAKRFGSTTKMRAEDILKTIEEHAADGVDFFTLHCGVTNEGIARLKKERRVTDVVSRG